MYLIKKLRMNFQNSIGYQKISLRVDGVGEPVLKMKCSITGLSRTLTVPSTVLTLASFSLPYLVRSGDN